MKLFVFGLGYSAMRYVDSARDSLASVAGTARSPAKAAQLATRGVEGHVFDGRHADEATRAALRACDALLVSIPPDSEGDPALRVYCETIAAAPAKRIVYLSTIGVYGDRGGAWVDESDAPAPANQRSRDRVVAEQQWLDLGARASKRVDVLRLSGIYGPGQNALVNLAEGTARRIVKPGQVFNRIHVEDIARAIAACFAGRGSGGVLNVTDDEPAPPQDVIEYAARLMGIAPPPELDFATADLSPMARSFYGETKRVSNRRLREVYGVDLGYPTYREGIAALWKAGDGRQAASALSPTM